MDVSERLATGARTQKLSFDAFDREADRLSYRFVIDGSPFAISIWYEGVDFIELERVYGTEPMQRLYFHIGAFNANQYLSLAPATVDFGAQARFADAAFEKVWREVFVRVWAQWRYENNLPYYRGPEFGPGPVSGEPMALRDARKTLVFCGGGKDSVVSQHLFDYAGLPYDSLTYSHSIYGAARYQHELIDKVLDHGKQGARYRISIFEDFLDSPVLGRTSYGIETLCAAETPASLFTSLPLALAQGYEAFVVGHERSAEFGNLVWEETGEEVNHQWGKSLEAEMLLTNYINARIVTGFRYYSILKPFGDVAIFNMGASELEALRYAHSCNLKKPWCMRCAKCAYVWINYRAYYPFAFSDPIFNDNLLDAPENKIWFRELLGLEEHTPFECVGQPDEARLAFELAKRAGQTGAAMADFESGNFEEPYADILARHLRLDETMASNIPPNVWSTVKPAATAVLEERGKLLLARLGSG